ncbi:MAG TPA: Rieske 2Fe-2S domain-containing protein [Bacteroidota bacterium]
MGELSNIGVEKDFPERRPRNISHRGMNVVVVKIDGSLFAFENNCPHQHFSVLHEGTLEGCSLTCPMHGWTFDLKSGNSTNGSGKLRMIEVKASEGSVWVGSVKNELNFSLFD